SRTLRLMTCCADSRPRASPWSLPIGTRPRLGLSPNSPQEDAGRRIEPPPSLAWATGRMPAATDAAAPPEEPPALCSRFHGLRVSPKRVPSVEGLLPNSGLLVLPKITRPDCLAFCT